MLIHYIRKSLLTAMQKIKAAAYKEIELLNTPIHHASTTTRCSSTMYYRQTFGNISAISTSPTSYSNTTGPTMAVQPGVAVLRRHSGYGYHSRCHNCEMSFDNLCSAALRLNSLLGIRKRSSRKLGEKIMVLATF